MDKCQQDIQGVRKKMRLRFCLISRQPSIGFSNNFFSPENWDPYKKFEYKTNSVRFFGVEIFAKQNGILIKTQIIWYRALTYFENVYDKNSYNIYQSVWVTRPTRSHLGAIRTRLGPVGGVWHKCCCFEATMRIDLFQNCISFCKYLGLLISHRNGFVFKIFVWISLFRRKKKIGKSGTWLPRY